MVNVSYQMVLSTLQTVGLLVGIFYYIMTLSNTRKNQQLQLETRQAQLYMQLMNKDTSPEFQRQRFDVQKMNIEDIEEHKRKLNIDREYSAMYTSFMFHCDNVGYLLESGLVDPEMVYKLGAGGWGPIGDWRKWKSYVEYAREERGAPDYLKGFEYYAEKMSEIRKRKGYIDLFPT